MENKNQFFLKDLNVYRGPYSDGTQTKLLDLSDKLEAVINDNSVDSPLHEDAILLKDEISNTLSKGNDDFHDRLIKLENTIGKYWEVKKMGGKNNDEVYKTKLIYAYRIINVNSTYWCVEGIVDDDYNSGMRDISFDVYSSFNNCQFTEITKDEFIRRVNEHVNEVLDIRLKKIKERHTQWYFK